jgi:uncharacterized protein (DUF1684 family)
MRTYSTIIDLGRKHSGEPNDAHRSSCRIDVVVRRDFYRTTLDFNKVFNPYRSVNAYLMCPIPPAENPLDLDIAAGETYFPE